MTAKLFDSLAEYYDVLHDDVDYAAECVTLETLFSRHGSRRPRTLLDLGCGTGNHALILAERGYRVTGIDASEGMLRVARRKGRGRANPRWLRADMRRFDLHCTFDAAICMDDAFTHLLTERDIVGHLRTVRRHLAADGVYVFEFAQALRRETEGPGWIHHGGATEILWFYDLTLDRRRHRLTAENRFFAFEADGRRRSFTNTYSTRVSSLPALRRLVERARMELVGAYTTGDGSELRPLRKDDPLPTAVVRPRA